MNIDFIDTVDGQVLPKTDCDNDKHYFIMFAHQDKPKDNGVRCYKCGKKVTIKLMKKAVKLVYAFRSLQ